MTVQPRHHLLIGNVHDQLDRLAPKSVTTIVTSPPYWGRRSYTDDPREIGRGALSEYVDDLVQVFRHCAQVSSDAVVMWLNLGDTASKSGGAGGDYLKGGSKEGRRPYSQGESGLPPGTWCNVPGRVVAALLDDGWLLRSEIIWDKTKVARPEDPRHVRRPLEQHEKIYMLTRAAAGPRHRYVWDDQAHRRIGLGDVWRFPAAAGDEATGDAPFPLELPLRCLALAPSAGPVLDPFCGSGATLVAADRVDRDAIGIDLNPAVADQVRPRVPVQVS